MINPQRGDDIVIDLETFDPFLTTKGTDAHCRRWGGYVFMVGVFHPASGELEVLPWNEKTKYRLRKWFQIGLKWWGANLKYDLGWLLSEKVLWPEHVNRSNKFPDVLIHAPLINETLPPYMYSLDKQCQLYELPTKPIDMLMEAARKAGVECTEKNVRGKLHLLPWDVVAEYNEHDLRATWAVAQKQAPLIVENKLERVIEMEDELLPVLAMMEHRGVRVDVEAAEQLYVDIYTNIEVIREELRQSWDGREVPLATSNALVEYILDRGHTLPETPASTETKPRYSTKAEVLLSLAQKDPMIAKIVMARKAEKIAKDFVKGAILDTHHNGRVHPNINQVVSFKYGDDKASKGVRVGRLSMDHPNLQQIPKRDGVGFDEDGNLVIDDKEIEAGLGTAMRRLFIAEEGCRLMSADFSSQEPRWIIHWAETWGIPGAKRIADMYRKDPSISSHDIVAEGLDAPGLSWKERRNLAKVINLGKGYEMGMKKLIANLMAKGLDVSQAQGIMDMYEREFPHVSAASKSAMAAAEKLGYVRTHLGRKLHFNQWEPVVYGLGPALPYEEAVKRYVSPETGRRSPIRRAFCYRAFNRIVQGSSADQTKMAMVMLWYDYGKLATLQIHDELVAADIKTVEDALVYKNVMENVVQLTIPSLTDVKLGPTWADGEKLEVAA